MHLRRPAEICTKQHFCIITSRNFFSSKNINKILCISLENEPFMDGCSKAVVWVDGMGLNYKFLYIVEKAPRQNLKKKYNSFSDRIEWESWRASWFIIKEQGWESMEADSDATSRQQEGLPTRWRLLPSVTFVEGKILILDALILFHKPSFILILVHIFLHPISYSLQDSNVADFWYFLLIPF